MIKVIMNARPCPLPRAPLDAAGLPDADPVGLDGEDVVGEIDELVAPASKVAVAMNWFHEAIVALGIVDVPSVFAEP